MFVGFAESKGFAITFENGFTVSVAFGQGSYSSNKMDETYEEGCLKATSAEIVIFDDNSSSSNGVPMELFGLKPDKLSSDGITLGWANPADFASVIAAVSGFTGRRD